MHEIMINILDWNIKFNSYLKKSPSTCALELNMVAGYRFRQEKMPELIEKMPEGKYLPRAKQVLIN